jgi:hypothetical protein
MSKIKNEHNARMPILSNSMGLSSHTLPFIIFCMGKYIAVDIGGTRIRVALYAKGQIEPLKQERILPKDQVAPWSAWSI